MPNICQDSLLACHGTEVHRLQMRQGRNHMIPKHTHMHTHYTSFESRPLTPGHFALFHVMNPQWMSNMDIFQSMQSRPCLYFPSVSRKLSQMRWILNQEPWCMRNLSSEGWPSFSMSVYQLLLCRREQDMNLNLSLISILAPIKTAIHLLALTNFRETHKIQYNCTFVQVRSSDLWLQYERPSLWRSHLAFCHS